MSGNGRRGRGRGVGLCKSSVGSVLSIGGGDMGGSGFAPEKQVAEANLSGIYENSIKYNGDRASTSEVSGTWSSCSGGVQTCKEQASAAASELHTHRMSPDANERDTVKEDVGAEVENGLRKLKMSQEINHCILPEKLRSAKLSNAVEVVTNFYTLKPKDVVIYKYGISITLVLIRKGCKISDKCLTEGESSWKRPLCNEILRYVLENRLGLKAVDYVYDGGNVLFTRVQLHLSELAGFELKRESLPSYVQDFIRREEAITVGISESEGNVNGFRLSDISSAITSHLAEQDRSLRQFYEILTNQGAVRNGTHYILGGGKVFLKDGADNGLNIGLGEGKKIVSGAEKGVRFIENDGTPVPALVIDSKKATFFDGQPLLSLASSIWKKSLDEVNAGNISDFVAVLEPVVSDIRLRNVMHGSMFSATGLSSKPAIDINIILNNKRVFSLVQMYSELGQKIRPNLPAVVYRTKNNEAYFPMEVLSVCDGQRVPLWKQTPRVGAAMIKHGAVSPMKHFNEIDRCLKALDLLNGAGSEVLRAFGVEVSEEPLKVMANRRQLPSVIFETTREVAVDKDKASWECRKMQYELPATIQHLFILYDKEGCNEVIRNFTKVLLKKASERGVRIVRNQIKHVPFGELEKFMNSISVDRNGAFIMYIDSRDDSHDDLKLLETLKQIITQHVDLSTAVDSINKPRTLENILNKMNCKSYGLCYRLVPEDCLLSKWITNGDTLVIGYDVCHPDPQPAFERRIGIPPTHPSVIGFSFNGAKHSEVFIGDYAYQEPRKEQVNNDILDERARWMLYTFYKNRGKLPQNIIITRDGVSEGQFIVAKELEMETIRDAMKDLAAVVLNTPGYNPKFALIVATKRHNKRFAVTNNIGECCNTLPGTVIDHTITRPDVTEVFIQSHRVIRGTAKVPAYVLLENEVGMDMDEMQSLMLALCFSHQIVFSAISIPEPIYQADEWAKRGRNVFRAMLKRTRGKLPRKQNKEVDWQVVTKKLCYMSKRLESTRVNA